MLKDSLKTIILSAIVLFLMGVAYAWTEPSQSPPLGNVSAPITTSGTGQTKTGSLEVNGLWNRGTTILDGNVGIGTASPMRKLHVGGGNSGSEALIGIRTDDRTAYLNIAQDDGNGGNTSSFQIRGLINNGSAGTNLQNIDLLTNRLYIPGNVGIGTTSPIYKLDVVGGSIRADGLKILGSNGYNYNLNILPNISYGGWQNGWYCCGGWPNNNEVGVNGGTDTCDGNVNAQYTCSGAPKKCNDAWNYWNGSCPYCGSGPNGSFRTVDCGTTASVTATY